MKPFLISTITIALSALLGQSAKVPAETPKVVLEDFIKTDLEGVRLSPEGLQKTSHFFLRQGSASPNNIILIVSGNFELKEGETTENKVTFNAFFTHFYGRLDSLARLQRASNRGPNGALVKDGFIVPYSLVRTEVQGRTETKANESKQLVDLPQWRIENPRVAATISLPTAIRYVADIRANTSDPVVKKNAQQTLDRLRKLADGPK